MSGLATDAQFQFADAAAQIGRVVGGGAGAAVGGVQASEIAGLDADVGGLGAADGARAFGGGQSGFQVRQTCAGGQVGGRRLSGRAVADPQVQGVQTRVQIGALARADACLRLSRG